MKLVRYRDEDRENYGVLTTKEVVCLPRLAKRLNKEFIGRIYSFGSKRC